MEKDPSKSPTQPASCRLKLSGAGCTTPHSRVGRAGLLGLRQSGTGGPSASTPPSTCRAACHQGFPQAARAKFSLTPTQRVQPPDTTPLTHSLQTQQEDFSSPGEVIPPAALQLRAKQPQALLICSELTAEQRGLWQRQPQPPQLSCHVIQAPQVKKPPLAPISTLLHKHIAPC